MGPGRDASLLQVIREELALGQLEPLRRWSSDLRTKDLEGGEHTMQHTDVVL